MDTDSAAAFLRGSGTSSEQQSVDVTARLAGFASFGVYCFARARYAKI